MKFAIPLRGLTCAALAIALCAGTGLAEEPAKPVAKPAEKPVAAKPAVPARPISSPGQDTRNALEYAGVVVDGDGKPIEGVTVTGYAYINKGELLSRPAGMSDAEGKFSFKIAKPSSGQMTLFAFKGKELGALVNMAPESNGELKLTLAPMREVALSFKTWDEEVTKTLTSGNYIYAIDSEGKRAQRFFYAPGENGGATLNLPAGEYDVWIRGRDCANKVVRIEVEAGEGVQKVDAIQLERTIIQAHMGKAAPKISPTAVRKLGAKFEEGKGLSLDDYKGKWVVVEFWGFW
ncbi:MAG: hypothetical protein KDB07_10595 [Planctomycetes bacterium]|nr:hypothetical protein [Planctomycetota bacterium]